MANTQVTPKQLELLLLDHLNPKYYTDEKDKRPYFIWGQMGIGKSEIVEQCTKFYGGKLIDMRLSQYDPTDIRGFPIYDKETKKMVWAQSSELPDLFEASKYELVTLFLDEMNSANPAVQAAAYQLVHNRRIGDYFLPANVRIIAAGNREGDRGVTYTMAKPLANRFLHFDLEPSFNDWFQWAVENDFTAYTLAYLSWAKQKLNTFDANSEDAAYSTPRTWEFSDRYGRKYAKGESSFELYMMQFGGCHGEGTKNEFEAFIKMQDQLPDTKRILDGTETKLDEEKVEVSGIYATVVNCCFALRDIAKQDKKLGTSDLPTACQHFFLFCMNNLKPELVVFAFTQLMSVYNIDIPFSKMGKVVLDRISKDYAQLLTDKKLK